MFLVEDLLLSYEAERDMHGDGPMFVVDFKQKLLMHGAKTQEIFELLEGQQSTLILDLSPTSPPLPSSPPSRDRVRLNHWGQLTLQTFENAIQIGY